MGLGLILDRHGERHIQVNGDLPLPLLLPLDVLLDVPLDARCGYTLDHMKPGSVAMNICKKNLNTVYILQIVIFISNKNIVNKENAT